jgi:hypothetical protein
VDWKAIKEIRLLLTALPERLVWGILISIVIIALAFITTPNPPTQAVGHSPATPASDHTNRG